MNNDLLSTRHDDKKLQSNVDNWIKKLRESTQVKSYKVQKTIANIPSHLSYFDTLDYIEKLKLDYPDNEIFLDKLNCIAYIEVYSDEAINNTIVTYKNSNSYANNIVKSFDNIAVSPKIETKKVKNIVAPVLKVKEPKIKKVKLKQPKKVLRNRDIQYYIDIFIEYVKEHKYITIPQFSELINKTLANVSKIFSKILLDKFFGKKKIGFNTYYFINPMPIEIDYIINANKERKKERILKAQIKAKKKHELEVKARIEIRNKNLISTRLLDFIGTSKKGYILNDIISHFKDLRRSQVQFNLGRLVNLGKLSSERKFSKQFNYKIKG